MEYGQYGPESCYFAGILKMSDLKISCSQFGGFYDQFWLQKNVVQSKSLHIDKPGRLINRVIKNKQKWSQISRSQN